MNPSRIYKYTTGQWCPADGCNESNVDSVTGLCRWHWAEKYDMKKCDRCHGIGSFCILSGGERVSYEDANRASNLHGEKHTIENCERCSGFGFVVPPPAAPSRGEQGAMF